jgi:hypothetical protein
LPDSIEEYQAALPAELRGLSRQKWVPWGWIRRSYTPGAPKPLVSLFEAYRELVSSKDPANLIPVPAAGSEDKCIRCGKCCALLNPAMTDQDRFDNWRTSGNPITGFVKEMARENARRSWYAGWFSGPARLRLCPLLLYCPDTQSHFCAVYHLGEGQRPEACEGFKANPPHCEVSQRPLVP